MDDWIVENLVPEEEQVKVESLAGAIDIEVPGIVPAPSVHQCVYVALGAFSILLVAAVAWGAVVTGDMSLWALPAAFTLLMAALIGSIVSNNVGKNSRIRLTRRKGCWAALGSRTGRLLMLTASVLTLLISAGFIIALPEAHLGVWLFGFIGLFGVFESAMRLRDPIGWHFDQYMVSVIVPMKGPTAFTWNEVERVEFKGRVVVMAGLGETVESSGGDIASDPAVLARVIEFYRSNARLRPELSDNRFLERLRSGQL